MTLTCNCGHQVSNDALICPGCGKPLPKADVAANNLAKPFMPTSVAGHYAMSSQESILGRGSGTAEVNSVPAAQGTAKRFCTRCGARLYANHVCGQVGQKETGVTDGIPKSAEAAVDSSERAKGLTRNEPEGLSRDRSVPSRETYHVRARCRHNGAPFLVKIKQTVKAEYVIASASPIREEALRNPSFAEEMIDGKIKLPAEYRGCPYCGDRGLLVCSCCKSGVACSSLSLLSRLAPILFRRCPWCHKVRVVVHRFRLTLPGGAD